MNFLRQHAGVWALAALAAASVIGFVALERGRVTHAEHERRAGLLLPAWRRDDVTGLTLAQTAPGAARLELRRTARGERTELDFEMLAPVPGDDIDAASVHRLLSTLELGTVVRAVDGEPAQFGEVQLRGELSMREVRFAFELGGEAPTPPGSHYLRITEARGAAEAVRAVYVVDASLVADLLESPHTYRSRQLVPYLSLVVQSLEVQRPAEPLRLVRKNAIAFVSDQDGVRVSRRRLDAIWGALAETRIERFLTEPAELAAAQQALSVPAFVVKLQPEEGPVAELRYGGACPGDPALRVVQRTAPSERLGCVPAEALQGLSVSRSALRDVGALSLFADEIEELAQAEGFDLARSEQGFKLRSPEVRELNGDERDGLDEALRFLASAEAEQVSTDEPSFAAQQTLRVRGGGQGPFGQELGEALQFGRCGTQYCVRRELDGAVLRYAPATAARLWPSLAWLRGGSLRLTADAERPEAIELACGMPQRLVRDDAGYALLEPRGLPLDAHAAFDLADLLRRARASAGVASTEVDLGFGRCKVHVTDQLGRTRTLALGSVAADGLQFARIEPGADVLLVAKELGEAAARGYVELRVWELEELPSAVSAALDDGRAWRMELREGDDASAAELALREQVMHAARMSRVLRYGPPVGEERFARPWLSLRFAHGEQVRQLEVGPARPDGSGHVARVQGREVSYLIEPEAAATLRELVQSRAPARGMP